MGFPIKDRDGNYIVLDSAVCDVKPLEEALEPALLGTYKVKLDANEVVCKTAFQLLSERVEDYPPSEASRISTVPEERIIEIARDLGTMKPHVCILVGDVSAQYSNSLQYQRAKQVLTCLLGIFDKPGGRYYGPYGSSGITLNRSSEFRIPVLVHPMTEDRVDFDPTVHRFIFTSERNYPTGCTQNFLKSIMTSKPYPIKVLFIIGSDVLSSHTRLWREAFKKVEFIVKSHVWPDDDVDYADIVLPEAAYLERDEGFAKITLYDPNNKKREFSFLSVIQRVVEPQFDERP